jgi:cell division protein FtsB
MAKALLGHVGGLDPRLVAEVTLLRRQVRDLRAEVLRLRAENDALAADAAREELLTLDVTEVEGSTPVLA